MYYPKLKAPARRRYLTTAFGGYDHRPLPAAGAFYEMENLCADRAPLLSVRPRRTEVGELDGCPVHRVLAVAGSGTPVVLDAAGSVWCEGQVLPRLLDCTTRLSGSLESGLAVEGLADGTILPLLPADGSYTAVYNRNRTRWELTGGGSFPMEAVLTQAQPEHGDVLTLRLSTTLANPGRRQTVMMGGWLCVFPDGRFVNTVRLRQGQTLIEGEDYGAIDRENVCRAGSVRFEPCGPDGQLWSVQVGETAPASGFWVDTSETEPVIKRYSQSQGLWIAVSPYVRCSAPGIAKGILAGDGVELFARLDPVQPDADLAEDFWTGFHAVTAAFHDPGAVDRDEGAGDYVVLPGLLPRDIELELTERDQQFLTLRRPLPEMDFVVECQNRLWGCRCGGGVNELYGSKLGDFRNWSVFEGLSTDSYRVSRGRDGAFTGAAVLGGCPLFFRENCLEKIYPARGGDHGAVTVDLEGVEAGSERSLVVIRDKLYYKSPRGICRYSGALPTSVSAALGPVRYHNAVAGTRDGKYYVTLLDEENRPNLFVFSPETGLWHRENLQAMDVTWSCGTRLYYNENTGGPLFCVGEARDSAGIAWSCETGDLGPVLGTARFDARLRLTCRLEPESELRVWLSYDDGPWLEKGVLYADRPRTRVLPIHPRRCNRLRLRLTGRGGAELQELSWLVERGSDTP